MKRMLCSGHMYSIIMQLRYLDLKFIIRIHSAPHSGTESAFYCSLNTCEFCEVFLCIIKLSFKQIL